MSNTRMQIVVSPKNIEKLKIWAKYHGATPSAFAGQILANRLEANIDLIAKLEQELLDDGISVDDLEDLD